MIKILYGTDYDTCRRVIEKSITQYEKKGYAVVRLSPETHTEEEILNHLLGEDLFHIQRVFLLSSVLQTASPTLLDTLFSLERNDTKHIICREDALTVSLQTRAKKAGSILEEYKHTHKKSDTIFKISESIALRSTKSAWMCYQELLFDGVSPHALLGIVWWQFKNMLFVARSGHNPGLSPYVYTKIKKSLQKYSLEELRQKAGAVVDIYHKARMGDDIEILLERFLLNTEK